MNRRVPAAPWRVAIALTAALAALAIDAQSVNDAPRAPATQTLKAPSPAERTAATIPSIAEVVCRASSYSAGLQCLPTGKKYCPSEVLYQRAARGPLQACPAKCVPQSASGGSCDCTFVESECRDRPRGP